MPKRSAGILLYRRRDDSLEVLLVHPGGPLWASKDLGAWTIPKGERREAEDPLTTARRELAEETGCRVEGTFLPLTPVRQAGGKIVEAWMVEGDWNPASLRSDTFTLEWPPRSGRKAEFPEVDRAVWFQLPEARCRILPSQLPLLDDLEAQIARVKDKS